MVNGLSINFYNHKEGHQRLYSSMYNTDLLKRPIEAPQQKGAYEEFRCKSL